MNIRHIISCLLLPIVSFSLQAQNYKVDAKKGLLLDSNDKEVSFFGFNYTMPFAHCYRMHKLKGINLKESITRDVYHMARMGSNAYRVHIWDVEISDSTGNLISNEHLDLFDYMLDQMEHRRIKITLTCMAYGGDGYPDGNSSNLKGFAMNCNKVECTYNERSIQAQIRYLKQLLNHINPYNHKKYKEDPDIVGFEIINEPKQNDQDKSTLITRYVTRLVNAIRSTGCKKPIIYNVSENPKVIKSYMASPINGVAFQWYPSGLVSGHCRQENILPLVSHYIIPFRKEKKFNHKARWIYEFDGADVGGSYLYPAMARAFREAGFQWATQFAYDPFWMANNNTDYQTHYLNLVYTPAKAVSYRIAAEAFRHLKLNKGYGDYPNNNNFDHFTVNYEKDYSVMNTDSMLAYSNTILNEPFNVNASTLHHIMGHGSSSIVKYNGTGVYFLDQIEQGIWRLEVYPDVLWLTDPFGTNSPDRDIAEIQNNNRNMQIQLPDLGQKYFYEALSPTENNKKIAIDGKINIRPGVWILYNQNKKETKISKSHPMDGYKVGEYFECPSDVKETQVIIDIPYRHNIGEDLSLLASIISPDSIDSVEWVGGIKNRQKIRIPMHYSGFGFNYQVTIPSEKLEEGPLEYSIVVYTHQGLMTFPATIAIDPLAWNFYSSQRYKTSIVSPDSPLEIFNGDKNLDNIELRNQTHSTITYLSKSIKISTTLQKGIQEDPAGLLFFLKDKLDCIGIKSKPFNKIKIQFNHPQKGTIVKVQIADKKGSLWEFSLTLNNKKIYEIPASTMKEIKYEQIRTSYPPFSFPECHCISKGKICNFQEATTLFVLLKSKEIQNSQYEIQKIEFIK